MVKARDKLKQFGLCINSLIWSEIDSRPRLRSPNLWENAIRLRLGVKKVRHQWAHENYQSLLIDEEDEEIDIDSNLNLSRCIETPE
jgi:hypothetical protein